MKHKLTTSLTTIAAIGSIAPIVVSCSNNNSLEKKLENLLSDNNIINIELNNEIDSSTGEKKIKNINDLFTLNESVLKIIESEKLTKWNQNLSEKDRDLFEIKISTNNIVSVVVPEFKNNENQLEIKSIDIKIQISAGQISQKIITKTLDLSSIDNIIYKDGDQKNNFIEINSIDDNESTNNELIQGIRKNTKNYIRNNSINVINEDIDFQFTGSTGNGYFSSQTNLYCLGLNQNQSVISLTIYSSDKKYESEDEIRNNCFAIKIPFNVTEFDTFN